MNKVTDILGNAKVRNAIFIGSLCAISYLAVYIARNMLSAVSPQMIEHGYSTEYIGRFSSLFFTLYAAGQLVNGVIGDKIKAKHMMGIGLIFAGICNAIFPKVIDAPMTAYIVYGMSGFFLSMIYAPMVKIIAENTELIYAVRCNMGHTFAALLGSPVAGIIAALCVWRSSFKVGGTILVVMGMVCFLCFSVMEKKGIVKYNSSVQKREKSIGLLQGVNVLIKHRIIIFSVIAILTGVVRTTVVFWLPTYLAQYLKFSAELSATVFTGATLIISFSTFVAIFIYERLHRNMDATVLLGFAVSTISFLLVFCIKNPFVNIVFMIVAIMASNCASTMMFSIYLPSLKETGMVSTATGFVNCLSYLSASVSSTIFANAVSSIGWGRLILVWCGLMVIGVAISLLGKINVKKKRRNENEEKGNAF